MSTLWRPMKAALLNGLGILLPVLLLLLILQEVVSFAAALADLALPGRLLESVSGPFAGALDSGVSLMC